MKKTNLLTVLLMGLTALAFMSCRNSGSNDILEINVDPQSASLARGQTMIFTAEKIATDIPPAHSVTWSIDQSNRDPETTISSDGRLRVANSEHLSALTVRATSTHDPSISGTATITINAGGSGGGGGGGSGGGGNHGSGGGPTPIGAAEFTFPDLAFDVDPDTIDLIATGSDFTISSVGWIPADNPLRPNISYIVTITLAANANHIFHDSGVNEFTGTIDANNAVVAITNSGQTATLSFTFAPLGTLAEQLDWLRTPPFPLSGNHTAYAVTPYEYLDLNEAILPSGINLTIKGFGNAQREVRLDENGSLFIVPSGRTLTLGENLTLVGRRPGGNGGMNNNSPLVQVNSGGTLIMQPGSKIASNTNVPSIPANRGGGVRVNAGGSFTMNGGIISNNVATTGELTAGGVLVIGAGASFTMNGGLIQNNTTGNTSSGGGVNIVDAATFTMTNGTIDDNTAGTGSGGGVNLVNFSEFEMTGGTISNNYAASGGGGVRVNRASFTMHTGGITGNETTEDQSGAGVSVLIAPGGTRPTADFTMHSGLISGNTGGGATGGGVNMGNFGTFVMHNGLITDNEVNTGGGGVRISGNSAVFEMRGGVITNNTAFGANSSSGVSVASANSTFQISNGQISGDAVTALSHFAALRSTGTAQRGTFTGSVFSPSIVGSPTLTNTHSPIHVISGVLQ